jgi:hypothetical protein
MEIDKVIHELELENKALKMENARLRNQGAMLKQKLSMLEFDNKANSEKLSMVLSVLSKANHTK